MKPTDTRWSNAGGIWALPIDLFVVVAVVLLTDAFVSAVEVWPVLRVIVGLPVLFFLPGYVLLAVLFPGEGVEGTARSAFASFHDSGGLPFSTRLALSFGLSVALVPVYSILLALSPVGLGASTILGLLTVHVVVGAVLGTARRMRLPPGERLCVPAGRWLSELHSFLTGGSSPLGTAINVMLVIAVVLAASGFAYAVFAPPEEAGYTDFMLLTESEDGEYVSSGYPNNLTRGGSAELVFGVTNHWDQPADYTVVVEIQRIRDRESGLQIVERSEIGRYQSTVSPNETWYRPHEVTADLAGDDLRIIYYLYRGDAPAQASMNSSDDYLQLWVNVTLESEANAG